MLTLIRCPFHHRVTAVARKRPRLLCQSAGGRLHTSTHTSLTQRSWSGLTMPLCRHSVGTYPETSSHATCQGTFGLSRLCSLSHCGLILDIKSGISVLGLISTSKQNKTNKQTNKQKTPQNTPKQNKTKQKQTNKQKQNKQKKTRRRVMNGRTFSPNPRKREKASMTSMTVRMTDHGDFDNDDDNT